MIYIQTYRYNLKICFKKGMINSLKKIKNFIKQHIVIILTTLIYAIISFINLGTLTNPQTFWKAEIQNDFVEFEVKDNPKYISKMRYFFGVIAGDYDIYISQDGTSYEFLESIEKNYEFSWNDINVGKTINKMKIVSKTDNTYIGEIQLYDKDGEKIFLKDLNGNAELLIDEPDTVPERIGYINSAYFDEIYHARTAYENVHNLDIYEWTHPPLGKLIIAIPIVFLKMNTFAYRLMGNLVGIAMIPIMYLLGLTIFKEKKYANFAAFLIACDGMHFAQTRIATVDSFLVFFIMLSFLFMFRYITLEETDRLKDKLKNLCLSGVFVGMAIATKWTGFYAGLGLAIIFFANLFKRLVIDKVDFSKERLLIIFKEKKWTKEASVIIANCAVFFIWIPIFIYALSYFPFYRNGRITDWASFWEVQSNMYNYHSKLEATHFFSSSWYTWPLMLKPVWYFERDYGIDGYSTISGMGNPIIWWIGIIGIIYTIIKLLMKLDKKSWMITIPILSMFLPYVGITRVMFLYHYFPVVPFMMLAIVNLMKKITEKTRKNYILLAVASIILIAFIYFYPVISGLVVPKSYIDSTKWLSTWYY